MALGRVLVAVALVLALAGRVGAETLLDANEAASSGDWPRVAAIVDPLLRGASLSKADRAEAFRLAGLAAYFQQQPDRADTLFFEYLRNDLEGRLDPALYPPDVVSFFETVKIRHAAELRALRPKQKRYLVLNLLPPWGQFQNGERTKGWVIAGALGTFAVANATSFFVLRSWCTRVTGFGGSSATCDGHESGAKRLAVVNVLSGIGLIGTYIYGVYDGVRGHRRHNRAERAYGPYVTVSNESTLVGVSGRF